MKLHILDIDGTLVYTKECKKDISNIVDEEGDSFSIIKRPHLEQLLNYSF